MRARHLLASAVSAAILAATTLAGAQQVYVSVGPGSYGPPPGPPGYGPPPGRRHTDALESRWEGSRVGLSTDIWGAQDFVIAGMGVGGQIAVTRNFALDFDLPWAVGSFKSIGTTSGFNSSGSEVGGAFGNITFGGHAVGHIDRDVVFAGGMSISIPTRYDFTGASSTSVAVQTFGAMSRALQDVHRLVPGTLFVRVPLGLEARFARFIYYRGELVPVVWAPVAKGGSHDPQVSLEHADEIEARAPFGFGGGLRVQFAFMLSNFGSTGSSSGGVLGGGDRAQVAMEPFIGYEPRGAGFFARLGLLMALDKPLGPGFDRDKLAVVRTTLGGKF